MLAFHLSLVLTVAFATSVALIPVRLAAKLDIPPNTQDQEEERKLEDATPKHVPIKLKIKAEKEKSFRDLTNEKWLAELEIEVKNTGTKPIYFFYVILQIPDPRLPTEVIDSIPLYYGRPALISITEPLKPEDVPIKPGETCVLRLPKNAVGGWDLLVKDWNLTQPKSMRILFQHMNFGDGTGLWNASAEPLPYRRRP